MAKILLSESMKISRSSSISRQRIFSMPSFVKWRVLRQTFSSDLSCVSSKSQRARRDLYKDEQRRFRQNRSATGFNQIANRGRTALKEVPAMRVWSVLADD